MPEEGIACTAPAATAAGLPAHTLLHCPTATSCCVAYLLPTLIALRPCHPCRLCMLRSPFGEKSESQVLQALLAWSEGDAAMAAAAIIPQYSRKLQGLLQSMLQVRGCDRAQCAGANASTHGSFKPCGRCDSLPELLSTPYSPLQGFSPFHPHAAAQAGGPPHRQPDPGAPRHSRAPSPPAGAAASGRVRAAVG